MCLATASIRAMSGTSYVMEAVITSTRPDDGGSKDLRNTNCYETARFCVGAFSRNPASVAVKMFSHSKVYE
jgi:hypothetical protein